VSVGRGKTLVVVTLRPATAADAAAVAAVWHDAWHDGHRGRVPDALLPDRDPAYFAGRARELVEHTTTPWDGERLLGVAIVVEDELQQLMVAAAKPSTAMRRASNGRGRLAITPSLRQAGADIEAGAPLLDVSARTSQK
jgi:hypothetical protein